MESVTQYSDPNEGNVIKWKEVQVEYQQVLIGKAQVLVKIMENKSKSTYSMYVTATKTENGNIMHDPEGILETFVMHVLSEIVFFKK